MAFPTGPRRTTSLLDMISYFNNMYTDFKSNEGLTKHSIYKVPPYISNTNKTAYEPHIVSIGPYHHGKPHLKSMEEHKHRALHHRLERSKKTIDYYRKVLDNKVKDLMDSYEQLDEEWRDQDKFLQLMLLDGFFLLELLRSYCSFNDHDIMDPAFSLLLSARIRNDYEINDPVFSIDGSVNILPYIVSDLLMVENQLPLLVLQTIIAIEWHVMGRQEHYTILNILVATFFIPAMKPDPDIRDGLHMLDIVRKLIIFGPPANTSSRYSLNFWPPANTSSQSSINFWPISKPRSHLSSAIMPSFSDLFDVRVKLKRSETQSIRDITFSNGILSLPVFIVGGGAKSFYLNVLAFERLHHRAGHEVSSFVAFMYGVRPKIGNRYSSDVRAELNTGSPRSRTDSPDSYDEAETSLVVHDLHELGAFVRRGTATFGGGEALFGNVSLWGDGLVWWSGEFDPHHGATTLPCRCLVFLGQIAEPLGEVVKASEAVADTAQRELSSVAGIYLLWDRWQPVSGWSFYTPSYGLIKSEKDARLLRSHGILYSTLDSDKAIADLTQELARDIYFDTNSPLCEVRDALYEYTIIKANENRMKRWSTRVREWRLAAAFLLVLTVIQTLYAVLAYHTNNK
ncbi:uncharacterized protein LOC143850185 [Tasmannia lanceolata]|uniref:uncharacterized protein LOC143850185 n=1 Tax=Tasmannia lanceolata TaxID=3420 RepID=UPI004063C43A